MRLLLATLSVAAIGALAATPASAQQPGVPAPEAAAAAPINRDPRVNQLIVYGEDPCPQSTNDEIIVCARLPEDDRYRIPERLRNDPNAPANQSWASARRSRPSGPAARAARAPPASSGRWAGW
jgi:hypothetical protein